MATTVVTPPALEPVSLEEMKAQLNITSDDDDVLITGKIKAAREFIERQLGQSLIETEYLITLDSFPRGSIEISGGPIVSVESVKYTAVDGTEATLAPADYSVDVASNPARVAVGASGWPSLGDGINRVRVAYLAGYGDAAADVPADLVEAIKMMAAHWYENREASLVSVSASLLPLGVQAILRERRNYSF